jgi:hypothetical protein
MRGLLWFLSFLIGIGLSPANAVCVMGVGNTCEPSEADGRQAFERLIATWVSPPYTISSFQKTNGTKGQVMGVDVFDMEFAGTIQPSSIKCRAPGCGDLAMYSVQVNKAADTIIIRGHFPFHNSQNGWVWP